MSRKRLTPFWAMMFAETMRYSGIAAGRYTPSKPIDTNANRKARKERARMLTRQREEELKAQRLSQKKRRVRHPLAHS